MKNYSICIIVLTTLMFACNKFSGNRKDSLKFICDKSPTEFNLFIIDSLSKNENKLSNFKVNDSVGFYKVLKKSFNSEIHSRMSSINWCFVICYIYNQFINIISYIIVIMYNIFEEFIFILFICNIVKPFRKIYGII